MSSYGSSLVQLVLCRRGLVMSIWAKAGLGLAWGVLCVGAGLNPFR